MSLTSIIKSWFAKPKPIVQKCTGYPDNNLKLKTDWLDNFNSYIQRNHGYKRMHAEEYLKFYGKARDDVLKASANGYEKKKNAVNYSYRWEYVR